jgi:Spy/CpxP family protein refolding chaperone
MTGIKVLAALAAFALSACAAPVDPNATGKSVAYEEREAATGSNIPSRQRRAAMTPEEREKARAEVEAIRDSQQRATPPRSAPPSGR